MIEEITQFTSYFSYNSLVILSYFFLCLFIYFLNIISQNKINLLLACRRGNPLNPLTYIRLITTGICHSNFQHLCNNFTFILLIGPMLEEKYGSIIMLQMIIITTIITSLCHILFSKASIIGTSNVVYMMVVLSSIVNIRDGKIPITLILIFLFFIADEIIKIIQRKKDLVAHDGHLIGALCGLIFGYFIF